MRTLTTRWSSLLVSVALSDGVVRSFAGRRSRLMGYHPLMRQPGSITMRYSDEELRRMKARRRELVATYGDKGQHHPMGRMIGGLNPAAQELYVLRGRIVQAEGERRGPSPVLTLISGSKGRHGLKFDIDYQGRRGKLGTDNFGRWYVVVGEGSDADVIASDLRTKGEATKVFVRLSGVYTTKKTAAQLAREIVEVIDSSSG